MNFAIDSKLSRAVILTGVFLVASYGFAIANEEVQIDADFKPCASPCVTVPGASGELEYEAEFLSNGVNIKEAKLAAVVKIPAVNNIGNSQTPGLVTLDLTRVNPTTHLAEAYATCTMALKRGSSKIFTYALKLSARVKDGVLVFGKKSLGSCDIDLVTLDVQPGIPVIQNGDIAFVSVSGTDILSAVLINQNDDDQGENENEQ